MTTATKTTPRKNTVRTNAARTNTARTNTARTNTARTNTVRVNGVPVNEATKPLFAYVGASDLAVEALRALPARYVATTKELRGSLTAQVKELPAAAKELRTLPTLVQNQVVALQDKALVRYTELAVRGEKLVASIRRQSATQQAAKAVKTTVAQAKGTTTTATKAAKATLSSAKGTRTIAKNAAKATVSSAKGTRTSAVKAAKATVVAVEDGANKVG
jgi:hypothetical protein